MGRKTHESLGRPLPGRTNIILTRQRTTPPRAASSPRPRTRPSSSRRKPAPRGHDHRRQRGLPRVSSPLRDDPPDCRARASFIGEVNLPEQAPRFTRVGEDSRGAVARRCQEPARGKLRRPEAAMDRPRPGFQTQSHAHPPPPFARGGGKTEWRATLFSSLRRGVRGGFFWQRPLHVRNTNENRTNPASPPMAAPMRCSRF